ncbi:hypothetical protein [Sphingomonas sp. PP-CE-1G-424]|uniref:hypothetical protein n=1 Tax=Sphingomonas sp. PP-CE-1G-424 TaxID=2135658 RepID=UPI001055CF12|nr:hypothetical protein [Sphingomonas sp. PP-CE-1G-424]TCP66854.1 hypothetical protein C8J43_104309 [Sphingomonas sp. PP-CE-1G-424]
MSDRSERLGIGGRIVGAILGMARAVVETYRLGGRAVKAAPLVLAIAVVPEFLQHIAEIHLGMFVSVEQFRALANDPLRWGFGYVKIAGFVIGILAVARFWSVRSVRRTLLVAPMTFVRVVVGLVVGLAVASPFMWLDKQGLPPAIAVPLQIVSGIIQGGFLIYIVGALIEDASVTPKRAITSLLPAGIVLSVLAAVAFGPAQALHMANHKLALGQPLPIVWALMVFDALWVGLFAALVGSALFVGVRTGLTWKGWTVHPRDLDAAVERADDALRFDIQTA